ncbi:MAG TPA: hypothetical protein VH815_12805, partial [Acidobacteriota bacterium]
PISVIHVEPIFVIHAAVIIVIHAARIKVIRERRIKAIHVVQISTTPDREMNIHAERNNVHPAIGVIGRIPEQHINLTDRQDLFINPVLHQLPDRNKNQQAFWS